MTTQTETRATVINRNAKYARVERITAMQMRIPHNMHQQDKYADAFADKLAYAMGIRHINTNELADILRVDRSVTKSWLSGRTVPHTYNTARLCAALRIDSAWLLGLKEGDDGE